MNNHQSKIKHTALCFIAVATALLSAGCAGTRPSEPLERPIASEDCSAGSILEWDGSAGPDTRTEAINNEIEFLEKTLGALPRDAQRTDRGAMLEDPVKLKVAIRGLTALLPEIPIAEAAVGEKDDLELSIPDESGRTLATAIIGYQQSGGYRLSQYTSTGWTTDDPTCK